MMKQSKDVIYKRRDAIFLDLLKHRDLSVTHLSSTYDVSELTIRRDFMYFEKKGLIERYYGGARLLDYKNTSIPEKNLSMLKNSIAKAAADLIDSGDIVFVNTSSTAILILKYLGDKEVTIITNNGQASLIPYKNRSNVILTGGELTPPKDSMTGDFALQMISQIRATKAILGCSGFSIEQGMTTSVRREVAINQMMISNCRGRRILVVDHGKIGQEANYKTGSVHEFDYLITDPFANDEVVQEIDEQTGIKVIKADLISY